MRKSTYVGDVRTSAERVQLLHFFDVDFASVHEMTCKSKYVKIDVFEKYGLGVTLLEVACQNGFKNWRVVENQVSWDDESLCLRS